MIDAATCADGESGYLLRIFLDSDLALAACRRFFRLSSKLMLLNSCCASLRSFSASDILSWPFQLLDHQAIEWPLRSSPSRDARNLA